MSLWNTQAVSRKKNSNDKIAKWEADTSTLAKELSGIPSDSNKVIKCYYLKSSAI